MQILKNGITTGTCVAAATKGALELICKKRIDKRIYLVTLNSHEVYVEVISHKIYSNGVKVVVRKFSGDDPDVTNGIEIEVRIKTFSKESDSFRLKDSIKKGFFYENYYLTGGIGLGRVTKAGLQIPVGKFAINLGPQQMIDSVVREYAKMHKEYFEKNNLIVKVSIPQGREKAKFTLNGKLGIKGGISILGTTGIVKPMSEEALKNSLYTELKVIKENLGGKYLIFSFGNYGERYCEKLGISSEYIVTISNFIGDMIGEAQNLKFEKILLIGHIGKAVKIAGGIFNTHSKIADARLEIMGANAFLFGERDIVVRKILNANTVEEASEYVENKEFFNYLAEKISKKSVEYSKETIKFETLIFNFKGESLGKSLGFDNLIEEFVGDDLKICQS